MMLIKTSVNVIYFGEDSWKKIYQEEIVITTDCIQKPQQEYRVLSGKDILSRIHQDHNDRSLCNM
jgi:hypothetical protein